ncbi:MAG: rubredoxin [Syntrophobacterales bacterium]|nr:MAG: rubredoxin [Syntrophobacterales bacterium]
MEGVRHISYPKKGEPRRGIAAGLLNKKIPEDRACPACGVGKGDCKTQGCYQHWGDRDEGRAYVRDLLGRRHRLEHKEFSWLLHSQGHHI